MITDYKDYLETKEEMIEYIKNNDVEPDTYSPERIIEITANKATLRSDGILLNATYQDIIAIDELCSYTHKKCEKMFPDAFSDRNGTYSLGVIGYSFKYCWPDEKFGVATEYAEENDSSVSYHGNGKGVTVNELHEILNDGTRNSTANAFIVLEVGQPSAILDIVNVIGIYSGRDFQHYRVFAKHVWKQYLQATKTKCYYNDVCGLQRQCKFDVEIFRQCFDDACSIVSDLQVEF